MKFENILFSIENSIASLSVKRPEKLNALNFETLSEMDKALDYIYKNSEIKAALITGSGEKSFVAGADIKELSQLTVADAYKTAQHGQGLFSKIENCPKPVIALVNGYALGGGCELALACHFRYASPNASFGLPEVGLGLIPGYGGTQRLTRLVGKGVALEMIMSGDIIQSTRALEIGLVNKIIESNALLEEGKKVLSRIISKGPIALKNCIEAVNRGLNGSLKEGLEIEAVLFSQLFSTSDMKEGITAFLEKRKPVFKGK